jgi:hypothetical protein
VAAHRGRHEDDAGTASELTGLSRSAAGRNGERPVAPPGPRFARPEDKPRVLRRARDGGGLRCANPPCGLRAKPLRHKIDTSPANCRQGLLSTRGKLAGRGTALAYKMVAARDNEMVKVEKKSSLIIVAKARIWASEGWQVVITDADGKSWAPAEFDRLLAA